MQFIDMGYTPLMKVQFNLTRLEELEMNLFYHGREEEAAELDQKEYFHPQSTHEQCSIQIFNGKYDD